MAVQWRSTVSIFDSVCQRFDLGVIKVVWFGRTAGCIEPIDTHMQVFNRKVHQKVYWIHSKQKYSNVVNHYFKSMLENQKGTRLMLAAQKPKIWSQIVPASLFSPLGNNSWNVYGEKNGC